MLWRKSKNLCQKSVMMGIAGNSVMSGNSYTDQILYTSLYRSESAGEVFLGTLEIVPDKEVD